MVVSCLLDRLSVRLIVSLAAAVVACGDRDSARAFDFFGLWGSDEIPPPVSRTAISYAVTIDVTRDDNGLKNAVQDASLLALQAPEGLAPRRRRARPARAKRFRSDHRRYVGRRLL
jgi:hypothetical protein